MVYYRRIIAFKKQWNEPLLATVKIWTIKSDL